MSLKTTHKKYVLEQIMLQYLYDGDIPTADQLAEDLVTYQETYPDLNMPTFAYVDFLVEPGDNSSALDMYSIASSISHDVGVMVREIYRVVEESSRFFDRWSIEMKRLSGFARRLEQRTDALLLLNEDTAGFFATVGDVFSDMNKIDTENTTARIDLHEASVSIDPLRSELSGSGSALIDISTITENDVSFSTLTRRPGVAYFTTNEGNTLHNIFKTDNSRWVGKVVAGSSGEMITELKAKLADKDLEVSKIIMQYTGPSNTSNSTVTCMFSADGYTWGLVPTSSSTKTLTGQMVWFFPLTTMRWVKFIFHKTSPDNIDNEYIYSIEHIRILGNQYSITTGDTFTSSSLYTLDQYEQPVLFSLTSLDACYEIPDDTGIDFYISASKDNSTWTGWTAIAPSDSEIVSHPKIINLSGADWKNNSSESAAILIDDTVTLDGTAQQKIVRTFNNTSYSFTGDGFVGYRFKSNFGVVNSAIMISVDEDPDPIGNTVVVWRNTRYKNINSYPDSLTVRNNPRGWGLDGNDYTCYFEIINSNGSTMNFGDRECIIDGVSVTGIVTIPVGVHRFSTDESNWYDISDNITALGSSISTEEQLSLVDPLYPYNHKLIIEGFPYATGTGFTGEKKYIGTDVSAEFYATRTSLFDLENNFSQQYGYFSVKGIGDSQDPALSVIVEFDGSNPDNSNELFLVKWRSGTTNASMYKYIKLKAELWTEDQGITPMITSYRLKLGI